MFGASRTHIAAAGVALILVFALRIQDASVRPLIGDVDIRHFIQYTPYYPGMDKLETHEIFSPAYENTRKIVLLGASNVDSIGCDYTWSTPAIEDKLRNAHYTCSITGQLNKLLQQEGLSNWRAFNLARNGAKMTSMLYTYARIHALKPEVVIYGDLFPYYAKENAGAKTMTVAQIAYLESFLAKYPDVSALWQKLKAALGKVKDGIPETGEGRQLPADAVHERASLSVILSGALAATRNQKLAEGPPFEIKYDVKTDAFARKVKFSREYAERSDPTRAFFGGFSILNRIQKADGGFFFAYDSPAYIYRQDAGRRQLLTEGKYGAFLKNESVPFGVYTDLPLTPITETYDGSHQTRAGNLVIARKLLDDLKRMKKVY